ncbi:MAG TPA: GAF domain-containing protein [Thermoanaerobaculia bacterium]|nr:GAF domain-containing protein [Thermoanaerobaculia bacterium]
MSITAESRKRLPETPLPLVVLAGFGEQQAEELAGLLETECRIAAARSARDARLARPAAVVCIGSLLSTIETRHLIAEAGDPGQGGPLLVLTGAGPDPAMFQDLIDADRLFYLSPGEPPPADLAALVRAALARWGAAGADGPVPAGLADALRTARRMAAQPDAASAGDLLQLAAEESVHADRAYCLLHDPVAETLWSRPAGMAGEERRESSAVGLVSFVARTGSGLRIEQASGDPRFERQADDPVGARCEHFLAVPVHNGGRGFSPPPSGEGGLKPRPASVLAVLCAVRDPGRAPFSDEDEAALELLAATVAPSLAQLTLAGRLESGEPMPGIFREEALEYHAAPGVREGDWLRLSPRWMPAVLWLLVGLVAAFLGFAVLSSIGEYSSGPAVVRLAGRTEVTASQAGQVTAVEVRPGDRVSAGRILVRFQNAREAAELARIEREWELQLVERLRDLSAGAAAQALIGLRAERDLARARLDERVVRAPRAGVVGDLRCRPDQYVAAGDILLSLTATDAQPALVAMLPGEHRPMLRAGMPLSLKLRGYTDAPQELIVTAVADEVVGPEEAKRLLGPEVAAAIPLNGPLVRIEARFPDATFESAGKSYELHDGMWGSAEVRVRSESMLVALVPGLRAVLERRRG